MKQMIHVQVNNVPLQMHYGATHKHALLRLDERLYKKVRANQATIYDQHGNEVQIDGALEEGGSYMVREHKTD